MAAHGNTNRLGERSVPEDILYRHVHVRNVYRKRTKRYIFAAAQLWQQNFIALAAVLHLDAHQDVLHHVFQSTVVFANVVHGTLDLGRNVG